MIQQHSCQFAIDFYCDESSKEACVCFKDTCNPGGIDIRIIICICITTYFFDNYAMLDIGKAIRRPVIWLATFCWIRWIQVTLWKLGDCIFFHPHLGKIPIFTNIFSKGLVQPPTRRPLGPFFVAFRAGQVYFGTCATQLLDIFADSESKGCSKIWLELLSVTTETMNGSFLLGRKLWKEEQWTIQIE